MNPAGVALVLAASFVLMGAGVIVSATSDGRLSAQHIVGTLLVAAGGYLLWRLVVVSKRALRG